MPTTKRRHHKKTTATPAVEYPRRGERISSPDYTFRVFAPAEARKVGISIDQGPWKSCRPAVGFWWFDWSGFEDGAHQGVVSMTDEDGLRVVSEPHEFLVELEPSLVGR